MTARPPARSARFSVFMTVAALAVVVLAIALAVVLLPRPVTLTLKPIAFSAIEDWQGDDHRAALAGFLKSCDRLLKLDPDTVYGTGPAARTGQAWRDVCDAAEAVDSDDPPAARAFFEGHFTAYRAYEGGTDRGLLTGYYEPDLRGSRTRHAPFLTPLYLRPPELVTVPLGRFLPEMQGRSIAGKVQNGQLVPYANRAEIDDGALSGRDLELLWVDDPVAAFFLEIQGSGRIRLDDGSMLRVGYAGKNGLPYTSIGRVLIERGEILPENMSLPALRDWLDRHPDEAVALMQENHSYVFFRTLDDSGPLGSQGVVLSPGRSLAVDRGVWPLGMPVWIDGQLPEALAGADAKLRRLVVAQDTGGAITGALRGDLFWGPGGRAEALAGHMRDAARFIVLLPGDPLPPDGHKP